MIDNMRHGRERVYHKWIKQLRDECLQQQTRRLEFRDELWSLNRIK